MIDEKLMVGTILKKYGVNGLAMYLQGSQGKCPYCDCFSPPHEDNCAFAEEALKALKAKEDSSEN